MYFHACYLIAPAAAAILSYLLLLVLRMYADKFLLRFYGEFVGTFVSSVCILEMNLISAHYGSTSIFFLMYAFFHLYFKHTYFMFTSLHGSPIVFIDLFYANNRSHVFSAFNTLFVLLTQICASLSGFQFTKFLWMYEDQFHNAALQYGCNTALSHSHPWYICLVFEAVGVLLCTLVDMKTPNKLKPLVRSVLTMSLIHYFGYATGLWMNPMLATTHTFRCRGHASDWQHFAVYWVGPVVGLFLAWEISLEFQSIFSSKKQKLY